MLPTGIRKWIVLQAQQQRVTELTLELQETHTKLEQSRALKDAADQRITEMTQELENNAGETAVPYLGYNHLFIPTCVVSISLSLIGCAHRFTPTWLCSSLHPYLIVFTSLSMQLLLTTKDHCGSYSDHLSADQLLGLMQLCSRCIMRSCSQRRKNLQGSKLLLRACQAKSDRTVAVDICTAALKAASFTYA